MDTLDSGNMTGDCSKTVGLYLGDRDLSAFSRKIKTTFGRFAADVSRMSGCDERFGASLLRLSHARLHLIALALSLCENYPAAGPIELHDLAVALVTTRPQDLIAQIYGRCPPGLLGSLRKLPNRPMTRPAYRALIRMLEEPRAAKVLWHAEKISPAMVAVLQRLDPILRRARFVTWLGLPSSVDVIDYLVMAIQKACPGIGRERLLRSLVSINDASSLEAWCDRWLAKAQLPNPPWDGTAILKPLRTVEEIRQAGRQFENCLTAKINLVLAKRRFYYVWSRPPGAVCELVNDSLVGWSVGQIKGRRNTCVNSRLTRRIKGVFSDHGIPRRLNYERLPDHVNIIGWTKLHVDW